jgi:hypothetical protein
MTLLLNFGVVVFSMAAAYCWMLSAFGRTFVPPWIDSVPVEPAGLPAHQALWNARAAGFAGLAAAFQGFLFLYNMAWPSLPH